VEKSIVLAGARAQKAGGDAAKENSRQQEAGAANVLLIDEVDVFFSQEFYGCTYDPICDFVSPEAATILTRIWQDRNSNISFELIQQMPEYAALKAKFQRDAGSLIDQHIHFMLEDVKTYDKPPGEVMSIKDEQDRVVAQKIHYRTQDSYSHLVRYRYKTAFLYLEHEQRYPLIKAELPAALTLLLPCGAFSYAEILRKGFFQCIMGVTGTNAKHLLVHVTGRNKSILSAQEH
jgi:hypothetical protein